MRHLKTYRVFESNENDVSGDIADICYDLTDDKFDIKIYDNFPGWGRIPGAGMNPPVDEGDKILFVTLSDHRDYNGFSFDEVREVVLRLIDYLGDRYKGCSVLSVGEYERSNINKKEIVEHNWLGNLTNLIIKYK